MVGLVDDDHVVRAGLCHDGVRRERRTGGIDPLRADGAHQQHRCEPERHDIEYQSLRDRPRATAARYNRCSTTASPNATTGASQSATRARVVRRTERHTFSDRAHDGEQHHEHEKASDDCLRAMAGHRHQSDRRDDRAHHAHQAGTTREDVRDAHEMLDDLATERHRIEVELDERLGWI